MNDQQRAAFEAWYEKEMGESPRMSVDIYTPFAAACWEAYQAAFASPEVQALRNDSERLEFLIAEECQVKTLTSLRKGKWYHLYWPDSEEAQSEWFTNPRAAINAAMEKK